MTLGWVLWEWGDEDADGVAEYEWGRDMEGNHTVRSWYWLDSDNDGLQDESGDCFWSEEGYLVWGEWRYYVGGVLVRMEICNDGDGMIDEIITY
jgi:hypothetical protein